MSVPEKRPNSPSSASFSIPYRRVIQLDLLLGAHYLLRSVSWEIWRASRSLSTSFVELKFGETPVRTVGKILAALPPFDSEDTIADLGCGRGRAAFYFHLLSGAKAVGYDVVGSYIQTARTVARQMGCADGVRFYDKDLRDVDLRDYSLIYACALCFGEETRQTLLKALLQATPGAWIVTVGWRPQHERLEQKAQFCAPFSWGKAGINVAQLV